MGGAYAQGEETTRTCEEKEGEEEEVVVPTTTIIYYTSNREDPVFEGRIIRSLLHSSGGKLPVISVSQKPMALGTNICVGEVGISGFNALRQYQIGVKAAKTRFVCSAESDTISPQDYFRFVPPTDDTFYLASPFYVMIANGWIRNMFYEKIPHEQCLVANRDMLIDRMEDEFKGRDEWEDIKAKASILTLTKNREMFPVHPPVVSIKTDRNMHKKTRVSWQSRCYELPGIGTYSGVIRKYKP